MFLPSVSYLAISNLLLKILMGGIIVNYLKDQFVYYFFKVIASLSLISLFFFIMINILGVTIPHISLGLDINSYFIYGTSGEIHMLKNAGMFWEPGAHAGILTLCLALNLKNLKFYWSQYQFQLVIIILTLLTTQSTTGYLAGFLILLFYFFKPKNIAISLIASTILFAVGYYIYETTDFLKDKIESQFEKTNEQGIGDFSNSRFGSLIFDWHYIAKHPLIGNGFDEKTRYADHQFLFSGTKGDVIGSGNGFSHYLACMGIFFMIGYFVLLWKATFVNGKLYGLLIISLVLINLQGEQWLNFPLYLGLPFLVLFRKEKQKTPPKYYS